jgi:DNA-binding NarL/FixJ family response regulator
MASPKDEWNTVTQFAVQNWSDASQYRYRERQYLLKNLIAKGETTCFLADPGVEVLQFAQLLTFRIAQGQDFEPFACTQAAPVLICYAGEDPHADMDSMHRVAKACADEAHPTSNVFYYHRGEERDTPTHLDTSDGQHALMRSLPKGCKVVIFTEIDAWFPHDRTSNHYTSPPHPFIAKLNKAGIAVVLFEQATKKTSVGATFAKKASNIIHLTVDPGAPTHIGGGFNIVRKKLDKGDAVPATIQFWFTELDDLLKFGWEFRDPANAKSITQMKISQRQIEVARLLASDKDITQKAIAAHLSVDAATISRDVAALKAQITTRQQTSELAEEWSSVPSTNLASEDVVKTEESSTAKVFRFGRGIGKAPVYRDGDESCESELATLNAPHRIPRKHGRGVGKAPINRECDESLESELAALGMA